MKQIKCSYCGKEFEQTHGLQKYCSEKCAYLRRRELVKSKLKNDPEYNKNFYLSKSISYEKYYKNKKNKILSYHKKRYVEKKSKLNKQNVEYLKRLTKEYPKEMSLRNSLRRHLNVNMPLEVLILNYDTIKKKYDDIFYRRVCINCGKNYKSCYSNKFCSNKCRNMSNNIKYNGHIPRDYKEVMKIGRK